MVKQQFHDISEGYLGPCSSTLWIGDHPNVIRSEWKVLDLNKRHKKWHWHTKNAVLVCICWYGCWRWPQRPIDQESSLLRSVFKLFKLGRLVLVLPSSQAWHDTLLLIMSIVPTELFNVSRLEAWHVKRFCLLRCPRGCEIMNSLSNSTSLPIRSAVSFLSTKICTFILASLSANRGKMKLSTLSMFLDQRFQGL